MQFSDQILIQEHQQFVSKHPLCNLLQSSHWAEIKRQWDHKFIGVYEDGTLIASSLILIKHLPAGFTMFYIPRGPILDFHNQELVNFYFQHLRTYAKKYHCLFIKFDPEIHIRDFTLDDEDVPYHKDTPTIISNITQAGAIHKGFTTYIKETIQPRFCMGVEKNNNMDEHVPRATLRSKNVALRKHVYVKRVGIEGLDDFARVMHMTEKRKNIQLRDKEYFRRLMETYDDEAYLFLAFVDPKKRYDELQQIMDHCQQQLQNKEHGRKQQKKYLAEQKQAQQEKASMEDIVNKYHGTTVIAGGLMIGYGDTVEMLYAGMNEDFRTFRPQYLTYMEQFTYAFEHGYRYVTMGGIEGTLEDGLAKYKANFNPSIHEFIGEFDMPVNPLLYGLSERFYELRKQLASHMHNLSKKPYFK